jgi:MFS family permease
MFHNNCFQDTLLIQPQPWPRLYKTYIVGLVSLLGLVGQSKHLRSSLLSCRIDFETVSSSMINPSYILLAADLGVTVTKASYLTTVFILFSGIMPMFLVPVANVYGRKSLYMVLLNLCDLSFY